MAPSTSPASYHEFDMSRLCQTIDETVKVLTLGAFVLMLRLGQKVWPSRERMLARSPLDPARVPSNSKVFAYHYRVHLVLFVLVLALSGQVVTIELHVRLMQDLFLLLQVIGNAVWCVNYRPLKGSFYAGVTAVCLLPHVYDYVQPLAVGVYYSGKQEFVNASRRVRFFTKAGDLVIPLVAIALVLVVSVQHRWNYAIVSRIGKAEQKKLQHYIF